MFGLISRSKSTATILSAAVLASALIAPAAFAASAGNSFEIPFYSTHAYYSNETTPAPGTISRTPVRHSAPPVVERSSASTACPGGYSWSSSDAGNGMSMPAPCRS